MLLYYLSAKQVKIVVTSGLLWTILPIICCFENESRYHGNMMVINITKIMLKCNQKIIQNQLAVTDKAIITKL